MKNILAIIVLNIFLLGCQTDYYKLSVYVNGNGMYKVSPEKNEYEDGETVTLTAIPDSGWKFRRWDGSTLSTKTNPFKLVMDGRKEITTVFGIPIEPNLTGNWDGDRLPITLVIKQPDEFEQNLIGHLVITLSGDEYIYDITGINNTPSVQLSCKKSGYYEIRYTGNVINDNRIEGYFTEAGDHYDCSLFRLTSSPIHKEKIPHLVKEVENEKFKQYKLRQLANEIH